MRDTTLNITNSSADGEGNVSANSELKSIELPTRQYQPISISVTPEFYSQDDLAQKFGVSPRTIEKHTQKGLIPGHIKIGRLNRYSRAVVDKHAARFGGQFLLPSISPTPKFHSNGGRR